VSENENIWLTADHHFHDPAVIKHTRRGASVHNERDDVVGGRLFRDAVEMDADLIERWNSVVQPGDLVYHLGDFCLQRDGLRAEHYMRQLNGTIHLITGNHDDAWAARQFMRSYQIYALKVLDVRIVLCHYALRVWQHCHKGSLHCFGHSHGRLPGLGRSMDVGVDTHEYYPYHVDEVIECLRNTEDYPYHRIPKGW